jgi:hypothetical protein
LEATVEGPSFAEFIEAERTRSAGYGGRTVLGAVVGG